MAVNAARAALAACDGGTGGTVPCARFEIGTVVPPDVEAVGEPEKNIQYAKPATPTTTKTTIAVFMLS